MTFTDDDLKKLKEFVKNNVIRREFDASGDETIAFKYKIEALLERLEAAERYIEFGTACGVNPTDLVKAENEWRKVAGKDNYH